MSTASADVARFWRHPGLPGVELLRAHFVRHAFTRHSHDAYTLAVIDAGTEVYDYRGTTHWVGADGIALVEPGVVHTGHSGGPEGWRYRVLYVDEEVVSAAAADLGMAAAPAFASSSAHDPAAAEVLRTAHRAAERGDRLSASSLTRQALHRLLAGHTRGRPAGAPTPAPHRMVDRAREILRERLADPPSLEELAATVGASPFSLLRAFQRDLGLPPHAYLNDVRVQLARRLLADGTPPAETAARLGFADQAHLTRHFKRRTGATPGAFRRGVHGAAERRAAAASGQLCGIA
ncbi:helix-turn-helix transcriptional regulator [Nocardiopsis composta]|uniref:AraC-like DNA-binding protein n=1 Tax=Nocardiopsis composta TaxID=157465 RepID=A0A7W8QK06_9ACTN|nr:AraC family transcriptional regulator [Nocardiopsis composta]MBB5431190.1 AraC-like DNA-binding protein [Nocardiopsis composta]